MSKIQLYSLATPNGQKVGVALEEMGFEYDAHTINIMEGDQFKPEFIKLNPNSKIPAIVDNGHAVFESGAILLYLAEKSGKFLSKDPLKRSETIQWVFFQMGGVGPMFGQFGHFYKFAKDKCDHPYPLERYATEAKRLLSVVDQRLANNHFIAGDDYSIADMAIFPWILCLDKFYNAREYLEFDKLKHIDAWLNRILAREATVRGLSVCGIN